MEIKRQTGRSMADVIAENYTGQPLAILCARYWYRGIVAEAGTDYVILSHVRAVEVTGPAAEPRPQTEDPIPSDMVIAVGAIEQFCQPYWVWHELQEVVKPPDEVAQRIAESVKKRKTA